jgi:hypothetical protein
MSNSCNVFIGNLSSHSRKTKKDKILSKNENELNIVFCKDGECKTNCVNLEI